MIPFVVIHAKYICYKQTTTINDMDWYIVLLPKRFQLCTVYMFKESVISWKNKSTRRSIPTSLNIVTTFNKWAISNSICLHSVTVYLRHHSKFNSDSHCVYIAFWTFFDKFVIIMKAILYLIVNTIFTKRKMLLSSVILLKMQSNF